MHLSPWRVICLVVVFVVSHWAFADQKIKTKSNIKNDRLAESSSASACADTKDAHSDGKTQCGSVEKSGAASSSPTQETKSQ